MPTKEIAPGVLAVTELPEDAADIFIGYFSNGLCYRGGDNKPQQNIIDLPSGQWSILGWSDELTEEQCKGIVGNKVFLSATESFQSLLRSQGITNRALIIKKEK